MRLETAARAVSTILTRRSHDERRSLLEFTRALVRIRRGHPALHRSKFSRAVRFTAPTSRTSIG